MAFLLIPEKIAPFKIAVWTSAVFVAAVILLRHVLPGIWHTVRGFQYLLRGPEVIDDLYEKAKGKPFKAETPSNSHILVSKPEHIEELSQASHKHLSLHAVAKELLQPKYTMRGFEWKDQRGVEGTGFVRALRSLMTPQLPLLLPTLKQTLEDEFDYQISGSKRSKDSVHLRVFPAVKKVIAKTNTLFFFGGDLYQNTEFTTAALQYPQDVYVAAELLRVMPGLLAPPMAGLATRNHRASKTMHRYLAPIIQRRLDCRDKEGPDKPLDVMQYLIDTSPRSNPWTVSRMIGEIMAVWFSSVHQLAMSSTFAIEDLCLHSECMGPLRQEQEQMFDDLDILNVNKLPLLDSFIKESSRLSTSDAIALRRKALKPVEMFNGTRIDRGSWVCVPSRAIAHDSIYYRDPECFDGFRFADRSALKEGQNPSLFTDSNPRWMIWGYGSTACPGRFYASAVTRMVLGYIIRNYDCWLLDEKAPRSMTWRTAIVPLSSTVVVLKPPPPLTNPAAGKNL